MIDPFGQAVQDYLSGIKGEKLWVHAEGFDADEIPIPYLFRTYGKMPDIEKSALDNCKGAVLDIGAGAGCHALYLQNKGVDVTALERSQLCVDAMQKQGVKQVVQADLFEYKEKRFDTLLLLMNGVGLAGFIANVKPFLLKLKSLLKPGGQILIDSSDLIYLYENEDGSVDIDLNAEYYGQMMYAFEYKHQKSDEFPWVYVDAETLQEIAIEAGFKTEIIAEGEHYDYLMCLKLK